MGVLTLDVRGGATVSAILGALVEAGASLSRIERDLASLGPGAVPIALRSSRAGSSLRLHAPRLAPPPRAWGEQRDRMALLAVDSPVAEVSVRVLEALAEARAVVRDEPVAEVEPDTLGGLDETAAAVALASALASLGSPTLLATAVGVGTGTVVTAFGEVDLPGAVVARLLRDRRTLPLPVAVEMVDPLAAAFVGAVTDELPAGEDHSRVDRLVAQGARAGRGAVHTREGEVGIVVAVAG